MQSAPAVTDKPPSITGLFVPSMHGLRGWAIAIILVFHVIVATQYVAQDALQRGLEEGAYLALDVLFFTTGFVLFLPVVAAGRFGNVRSFLIRRFWRIAPPYYVCLLVILIAYPVLISDAEAAKAANSPSDYLIHIAFLQRELLTSEAGLGVNGPLWALSMDLIFYLVLPAVAGAYLRRPLIGLAVAFGVSLAWRLLVNEPVTQPDLLIQFPLFCVDFAAGMTAAWALLRLRRPDAPQVGARVTVPLAVVSLVGLLALVYATGATVPFHAGSGVFQGSDAASVAFPLVLGVFVLAVALAPAWAQWPMTNRASLWFSEISYSVYLYHVMVMVFAGYTLGLASNGTPRAVLTMAAVAIPITLVLAVISYRSVELPTRRYGRTLARRVGRGRELEASAAPARSAALGTPGRMSTRPSPEP